MKNLKSVLTITLLSFFTLGGCTNGSSSVEDSVIENNSIDRNSIKSDAQKLVDLQCKVMKLIGEAKSGDATALLKSEEFNQEAEKVSRELKDKYTSESEREEFALAYQEALGECK